jgi:hypothetical protein
MLQMLGGERRWWKARVPFPLLVVSASSFLTAILVVAIFQSSHNTRLPEGNVVAVATKPAPPVSPKIKPAPGLWVARRRGTGIGWAQASKLAQSAKNSQPPIGNDGEGEVVAIAIITDDLRWVPERQVHEGAVYLNQFFWVNCFLHN